MQRKWFALVTFYADTPSDDALADDMADRLSAALTAAVTSLDPAISDGSVAVVELDNVAEGWAVSARLGRET